MLNQQELAERKTAESALIESEQRFRSLSEAAFEGIMIHDAGNIQDANQAFADLVGYRDPEDLIGKNGLEILPFTSESLDRIKRNLSSGLTEPLEITVTRSDGSTYPAETQGKDITFNGRKLRVVAMRDITERKQAEEQLRKLSRAVEQSPASIVITSRTGEIEYVNPKFTQITGYTLNEALGNNPRILKSGHTTQEEYKQLWETITSGREWQGEFHNKKKNGDLYWEYAVISSISNDRSEITHFVAVFDNITERKQVERERENLIAELTAKNAELERFTYTVSHDLKSPLVTIMGFLGYLEEDAMSGNVERLKVDSQRIANAVEKMQYLLRDLLELSRIGRFVNPSGAILFEELVHAAIEAVDGRIQQRGITVQIQLNLPKVYGDRQRLTEALQNLLDNAAKNMGDQSEPLIEIGQRGEQDGNPCFYVKDNGIGIAPEYRERIFGLFNKLDARSEGTGIGLALVKRIIEFHGGRIWVESELNKGAIFLFTLPTQPYLDSVI